MHRHHVLWLAWHDLFQFLHALSALQPIPHVPDTYQVVKHALIELLLNFPALPQLVIVIVQARPVLLEALRTGFVQVCYPDVPAISSLVYSSSDTILGSELSQAASSRRWYKSPLAVYSHAGRAPRHLAPLAQASVLARAVRLLLALHEVVIVRPAPRADEVGRAQQRCRGRAQLVDLGDAGRQRRGVDERRVRESGAEVSHWGCWTLREERGRTHNGSR